MIFAENQKIKEWLETNVKGTVPSGISLEQIIAGLKFLDQCGFITAPAHGGSRQFEFVDVDELREKLVARYSNPDGIQALIRLDLMPKDPFQTLIPRQIEVRWETGVGFEVMPFKVDLDRQMPVSD